MRSTRSSRYRLKQKKTKVISSETVDVFKEISARKSPIIPISDFIEIAPENEGKIEKNYH